MKWFGRRAGSFSSPSKRALRGLSLRHSASACAHGGLEALLELGHELVVGGIDLAVREGALGVAVGEGVGQALLSGGDVLAAEDVEEFHAFQVLGLGLLDGGQHGVVGGGFGHDHREVAACLLEDWGLPMIFLQAVEHHEFPDQANFPLGSGAHALTQAIHFATLLGKACVADITARWQLLPTLYHVGAQLGISVESMASTFDSVTATWQEWGALLEVSTPVLPSLSEIEALGPLFLKEQERRGKGQASNPVQLGVLIVSSNKSLLKDIRNELSKSNYAITETATLGLAPTGPGEGSEQLIIYDWVNGAHDAPDLAQAPRWGNDKRPRHFIALLPAGQEQLIPKAIEAGFDRAWLAIRDSNLTTFIACIILYWLGSTAAASAPA